MSGVASAVFAMIRWHPFDYAAATHLDLAFSERIKPRLVPTRVAVDDWNRVLGTAMLASERSRKPLSLTLISHQPFFTHFQSKLTIKPYYAVNFINVEL